jgi:two-component SAPR family response regulator
MEEAEQLMQRAIQIKSLCEEHYQEYFQNVLNTV